MKPLPNDPYKAHQEISLLLPWYVNKSLHGAEANMVENHLKVCLTCKRELASLHRLAAAVQQDGSIDTAAQASFSHLMKRIHNADANTLENAQKVIPLPLRPKSEGNAWRLPRPALALAAVVMLSLLMTRVMDINKAQMHEYRTLSNAESPAISQNSLNIIFASDTKQSEINEILASVDGQIVGGPNAQGIYTITSKDEPATKNALDMLALLRKNTHVIFAEPAYALLSSDHADKDTK